MADNKKHGNGREGQYARYASSGKYASNKKKKLERTLRKQPNNEQLITALKSIANYTRSKPKTRKWSKTAIREQYIKKLFSKINLNPVQPNIRRVTPWM